MRLLKRFELYLRKPLSFHLMIGCGLLLIPAFGCAQEGASAGSLIVNQQPTTQTPQSTAQDPPTTILTQQPGSNPKVAGVQKEKKMETATFGAGCFWCVEAVFAELKGVQTVKSGYMGGQTLNPTYKDICTGTTGHAEVIHIEYDPDVVSFDVLLQVFWKTHDPTTLNRQGNDVGTQYRSAVFYHNDAQKEKAASYKKKLNSVNAYPQPIVTEISPATKFYVAENYHQEYFKNNPNQPYCRALIPPKLEKLKQVFGDKLK